MGELLKFQQSRDRVPGDREGGDGCSRRVAQPRKGTPRSVAPSQSGAARKAALTVFVMKGELQRVLQQGPEHAVGRRNKGGIQGERSGHFLHRDALKFFSKKKKPQPPPKMLLSFFLRPLPKVLAFKAVETRKKLLISL